MLGAVKADDGLASTTITFPSWGDIARLLPATSESASRVASSCRRSVPSGSSSSLSSTRDRAKAVRGKTLFRRGPEVCDSVRFEVLDAALKGVGTACPEVLEVVDRRGARSVSSIAMPSGLRIFLPSQQSARE